MQGNLFSNMVSVSDVCVETTLGEQWWFDNHLNKACFGAGKH